MPPGARPWNLSEESTLMCCRTTAGSSFGIDARGTDGAGSVAAALPAVEAAGAAPGADDADCAGASLRLHAAQAKSATVSVTAARAGEVVDISDNSIEGGEIQGGSRRARAGDVEARPGLAKRGTAAGARRRRHGERPCGRGSAGRRGSRT